jgi:3-oxoisoapionate kinase
MGTLKPSDRILAVSGSCSPVTGRQINWALDHDFADFALNSGTQINSSAQSIIAALRSGRSAILHTCSGPNDPRLNAATADASNLGIMLGKILNDVVKSRCVHRVAIFGGDTSGSVAHSLGIDALEYAGPLEPGAPLCRVRSRHEAVNGLEIVFKGGQVGYDNFLNTVLQGRQDQ